MPSGQRDYSRRRRSRGMPVGLVVALLITALAVGGVVGYAIYRRAPKDAPNGKVNVFESMAPAQGTSAQGTPAPAAETEDDLTGSFVDQNEAVDLLSGDNAAAALNNPFEAADEAVLADALASIEEPVVVAEYAGGKVMSNEVVDVYNEIVSTYLMAGFSVEEYADELLEDVLYEEVCSRIARQKAEELGLTEMTDADEAAVAEQAKAVFEDLIVAGETVGQKYLNEQPPLPDKGSCIIVLATDAPVSDRQLLRLAKRAQSGLARTGCFSGNGSGELALAFSTNNRIPHYSPKAILQTQQFHDDDMDLLFHATIECVEESVISSMLHAEHMVGREGTVRYSLSEILSKIGTDL